MYFFIRGVVAKLWRRNSYGVVGLDFLLSPSGFESILGKEVCVTGIGFLAGVGIGIRS
jgi:hypothetical protein